MCVIVVDVTNECNGVLWCGPIYNCIPATRVYLFVKVEKLFDDFNCEHNRGVSVGGDLGDLLLSPLVQPHLTSTLHRDGYYIRNNPSVLKRLVDQRSGIVK